MKLSQFIAKLQDFKIEHGDLEVFYASDDEGNEYRKLHHSPTLMYLGHAEVNGYLANLYPSDEAQEDDIPVVVVN